ncbi:MAG: PEP-CTERM sorting domain-containing protein [Rhizobiales bacterium]|nr:PEP-CTERM sorting domain-containing protein [Rhizobacter sp.]
MKFALKTQVGACALAALFFATTTQSQTLGAPFSSDYSVNSLGSVAGLPSNYGGLAFIDNNTLLIGGAANTASGSLYTIDVTRDAENHITGFVGSAVRFGTSIGEYNDGGVTFGPGGVLFTSRWPINGLGQTKPGSVAEDKVIELAPLGVASSNSAINFVPGGFGGAGSVKLVSYGGGQWYSGSLAPDGNGTFDLVGLAQVDLDLGAAGIQSLPGGPEGFVYITGANAGFSVNSMLVSEYAAGTVAAYEVDANGDPLLSSRRTFLSGLSGAEGAVIDPVTGDFLFSTFGGGSRVVVVSGFLAPLPPIDPGPTPAVPEPTTWAMLGLGLLGMAFAARKRHRS